MVEIVSTKGNVLGMHPEGTRGKGDDPYTFLPAQPGVGKLALVGQPIVIPAFNLGLGNNILNDIRQNFTKDARSKHAVITVFGKPLDYSDLMAEKPRPTLYKKTADRFMAEIKKLSEREKELRVEIESGAISLDDPRWLALGGLAALGAVTVSSATPGRATAGGGSRATPSPAATKPLSVSASSPSKATLGRKPASLHRSSVILRRP